MDASSAKASPATASNTRSASDREIILRRVFDAPRDLVFRAWTEPQHVAQWWGPQGFSTTIFEMDVRAGGVWRLTMRGPDGQEYKNRLVFLEVAKPERLVFKHEPEEGCEPANHETTVTFTARGEKTEVTMRMLFESATERNRIVEKYRAIDGGNQTLGRLSDHLAEMSAAKSAGNDLVMTRIFDAPRELVFGAWSKPEHMSRWFGPKGFTLPVCEMDFRPGGKFRHVMRGPDGKDYPFDGTYLEIIPPERLVFEGFIHDVPGNKVHTTVSFADQQGKTKLTVHQVYSFESDATRGAPMGWAQTLDRLTAFVAGS